MITGKSILHVEQDVGKIYSLSDVKGYYNDMTNKVLLDKKHYESTEVFETETSYGDRVLFSISIFQYGLGAYDLFLLGSAEKELMNKKFEAAAKWAFDNLDEKGRWDTFGFLYKNYPYSCMAQGEGASLLIRYFKETGKEEYLDAAKKALDFMLTPLEKGGTASYKKEGLVLYEYTNQPIVFNGWIYGLFGLLDAVIATGDKKYGDALESTLQAFKAHLKDMDNGYWSMYNMGEKIASPSYHSWHIALLEVLYEYTQDEQLKYYLEKFKFYASKKRNRYKAFWKKAWQKIFEKRTKN